MDPLSLLRLPSARPSIALPTTAPLNAGPAAARLVPQGRWGRAARRLSSVSAVVDETPRTEDPPSPSPSPSDEEERFDWMDQWYPVAPVCDLDPRAPHGKTVLGLHIVAWFDRTVAGGGEWRVFDDACSHRLAPLSEGRIDDKGRLQCVYHGWCFDGRGACQFIPQAPALGPPVHNNSKACVASYPQRGAEQHPVVLPEERSRAQGRAAEEAAALHPGDRRPLLRHRVRHQGPPLRVTTLTTRLQKTPDKISINRTLCKKKNSGNLQRM